VAIVVPAGYFVVAYAEVRHELAFSAQLKANRLARYIYSHQELWQYQSLRLAELIEVPEANEADNRQRVFDATGELVVQTGAAPAFPVAEASTPVVVAGLTVGRIETAATLRDILVETGFAALFSSFLGFAMFFSLRLLPLRVIDRILGALASQTVRFETSLDNMSQGLCMFDADRKLVVFNKRYAELFGIPAEKIVPGMTELQLQALSTAANSGSAGDWASFEDGGILRRANGNVIAGFRKPMASGGVVVTYEDITQRSLAEGKIFHMARHDALTELPNRRLFHEELEYALKHADAGESVAVLYLDIDNFKKVNDTLGHPVGDELLKQIAGRLRSAVRAADTVARLGGDEFAIIQTRLTQPLNATDLAVRVVESLGEPYVIDGQQIVVGTSIGIALSPNDGNEPYQLLKNADMALYRAKAEGRGTHRYFEVEMDARVRQRHAVEMDLRRALAMEEFELYYQPIIKIDSEEIIGFEALLRWNHPERGMIAPNDFIPTAEETGQIIAIGEWVIRTACNEAATWPRHVKVAVNLSPVQITSHSLVTVVKSALAASGLSASCLELEITETVMLQDDEKTMRVLNELHDLGVRISMDDFGTGYSSLSLLRKFPFDKIKIDRSFISEMADRSDSLAIIRAVSAIGVSLGMLTTAEGVETRDQFELVKKEGCTEVQGYLFSRPKPAGEIAKLFAENTRRVNAQAKLKLATVG
jgi:diguanylate cyclase (GGDEF)-like protein